MINAETVFTELAKELHKNGFPTGAVCVTNALATARQADAPTIREITHAEKLAELRDNPQVGDAWKYRGELRTIAAVCPLRLKGIEPENIYPVVEAYVDICGNSITDIRLVPRPPKPAPATCAGCEEAEVIHYAITAFKAVCGADVPNQKTTRDYRTSTCVACLRVAVESRPTHYYERWELAAKLNSQLEAERDTALARVKELEGKAATGAVREREAAEKITPAPDDVTVFKDDANCYFALRAGKCWVLGSDSTWEENEGGVSCPKAWKQIFPDDREPSPAEVAYLLAKSPLPDEVKP